MKIVIATNIWISALISQGGSSRDVIRLALQEHIFPQISTSLLLEYESVMKRAKIQEHRFQLIIITHFFSLSSSNHTYQVVVYKP